MLVTNDEENPRIPIYVGGRIVPQISVSPESLLLGDVTQGQQVSKKIIVRGKKPFKIVSVQCDDEDCFQFKTDDQSSERHVVEVIFDAKKDAGDVKEPIRIATDLGDKFQATLTAYATIVPAPRRRLPRIRPAQLPRPMLAKPPLLTPSRQRRPPVERA